jgi:alpha-L-rhamnosidase
MVPGDKKEAVLKNLVNDITRTHSNHLNTGIVGTRYILDVLTKYGQVELAYKIATQTTYPSWGYMIREGATTIWERWEYLVNSGMNSHNHIMFGSVDAWFYKVLAGINLDFTVPGFQQIIINPYAVGDLKYVSASLKTVRGMVSSSWTKNRSSLVLNVTLPVNSEAKVSIPKIGLENILVKESGKVIWEKGSYVAGVAGITSGSENNKCVTFEVGAGTYFFEISGVSPIEPE